MRTPLYLIRLLPLIMLLSPDCSVNWTIPHDLIQEEPRENIILKSQVSFGQGELLIKENLAQK